MKILLLEAFYGGSHKVFVDTFCKHSYHDIDVLTLPGRFFKWRTRGASYEFIKRIDNISQYDIIFCGSMLSVSDLVNYYRKDLRAPIVTYFHETQFSYPLKKGEAFDVQFGLNDVSTAMASDYCIFNSYFHQKQFKNDMRKYLSKMPDFQPLWVIDEIMDKSSVIYPCSDFPSRLIDEELGNIKSKKLLNIVFNHRWEHDKNPDEFFQTLHRVSKRGYKFNLYVLGESYKTIPDIFIWAQENLASHIKHFGYLDSKEDYYKTLALCDLVISTAWQENYGISVVEAMSFGCLGLLPNRLSYKELLNDERIFSYLYENLEDSIIEVLEMNIEDLERDKKVFLDCMKQYKTHTLVSQLDLFFTDIV